MRVVIAVIGLVWGLASEALYYRSGAPAPDVLRDLAVGWTYLFGGLAIWSSRPANPTGRLMTLVGFTWFIGNLQLADIGLLDAIGTAFADVIFVCLIALILAYPTGHLETRLDRSRWSSSRSARPSTTRSGCSRGRPGSTRPGAAVCRCRPRELRRHRRHPPLGRCPGAARGELLPVLIGGAVLMGVLVTSLAIQSSMSPRASRRSCWPRAGSPRPRSPWRSWSGSTARASSASARFSTRSPT